MSRTRNSDCSTKSIRPIRPLSSIDNVWLARIIQLRLQLDGSLSGEEPRIYEHEGREVQITRIFFDPDNGRWTFHLRHVDDSDSSFDYTPVVEMTANLRAKTDGYLRRVERRLARH